MLLAHAKHAPLRWDGFFASLRMTNNRLVFIKRFCCHSEERSDEESVHVGKHVKKGDISPVGQASLPAYAPGRAGTPAPPWSAFRFFNTLLAQSAWP